MTAGRDVTSNFLGQISDSRRASRTKLRPTSVVNTLTVYSRKPERADLQAEGPDGQGCELVESLAVGRGNSIDEGCQVVHYNLSPDDYVVRRVDDTTGQRTVRLRIDGSRGR